MQILTHDQLHRNAPAIFADQPDEAVSERYGFVPTINVVEALEDEGWHPVRAQQTNVRDPARKTTTRHLVRFRQDPDRQITVGDSVAELVLTNSHDRTSSFQLHLGLFRLVCSNGMVTPMGQMGEIRVCHGREIVEEVLDGSVFLSQLVPNIAEGVERFRSTLISPATAWWYAEAALALRYGQDWRKTSPIQAGDLLEARRSEDANDSLWSVFNRTQENLFKGGLRGRSATGRRTRTRPINSVTEDVRLNRALWKLTEQVANSKQTGLAA